MFFSPLALTTSEILGPIAQSVKTFLDLFSGLAGNSADD